MLYFCFQGCSNLKTATIKPDSCLSSIGNQVFWGTMLETFFIPKSLTFIDAFAFDKTIALKEFYIDPSNSVYSVSDGILFNRDQTVLVKFPTNKSSSYSIPESVTIISDDAFAFSIIESVQFPSNLVTIGRWCFGQTRLQSLVIPDTVVNVGEGAFYNCGSLNTIVIGKQMSYIPDYCFINTNISQVTIPNGTSSIGSYAFSECKYLNEIVLPSTLKNLGASCFPNHAKLTFSEGSEIYFDEQQKFVYNKNKTIIFMCLEKRDSYVIPSTVELISKDVFLSNDFLVKVEFEPNSCLNEIGDKAFYGCLKLSNIIVPSSVSKFGSQSFSCCPLLRSIFFGSKLKLISSNCFEYCTSLSMISFADSKISADIKQFAFAGCTSLNSITLREGILTLDMYCFRDCTSITSINIPSTVIFIGSNAFSNTNINKITFSSGNQMRVLNPYTFSGCSTLQQIINIPSSIESIESNSFEFTKIETFTVPVSTVNISHYAFRGCTSMTKFTIPSGSSLKSIGNFIFEGCTSLSVIECIDSDYFVVDNGALFNKSRSHLIYFPPASTIKFFCFSRNVKSVSSSAFFGCKRLEGIMIPENSIESIGFSAFAGCTSLKYINIPICVKTIEQNAFSGCINLHCGVNIQNKTREFVENLVTNAGLSRSSLRDCSIITCKQVFSQNSISSLYYFVFIIM